MMEFRSGYELAKVGTKYVLYVTNIGGMVRDTLEEVFETIRHIEANGFDAYLEEKKK